MPGRGRDASLQSAAGRHAASWCSRWLGWLVSGALPQAHPPYILLNSLHPAIGSLPATRHRGSVKMLSAAHLSQSSGLLLDDPIS